MPKKHGISFKHLIATSSQDLDRTYPNPNPFNAGSSSAGHDSGPGVQELLSRSRLARPIRPRLVDDVEGAVWVARPLGRLDLELEEGPMEIHPAEMLRRAQLAQRQAQRSVAGPAPPLSWRSTRRAQKPVAATPRNALQADEMDLYESARLFSPFSGGARSTPRTNGAGRLMEYVFKAVIRDLDSNEIVRIEYPSEPVGGTEMKSQGIVLDVSLGRAIREEILPHFDSHLRDAMMAFNSGRPSDKQRMSDQSLRALLSPAKSLDTDLDAENSTASPEIQTDTDEWDDPSPGRELETIELVHHLAITLHPSPHTLLRCIAHSPLVALTSLDLSYSTLPSHVDRLVNALPIGLRELSLAGVRITADEKDWTRALGLLGRRLLVLKMLDLSFLEPARVDTKNLEALLHPPHRQLPSLRLLGLRNPKLHVDSSRPLISLESEKSGATSYTSQQRDRRELSHVIRRDRRLFVEIVWQ